MMKKTLLALTLFVCVTSNSAFAADKTFPLETFSAVEARQGINLTIKCAATPSMVVSGSQDSLNKLKVTNNSHALLLVNDAAENDRFISHTLDITLYTSGPLNSLAGKAGVKIAVPACAVDPKTLAVSGSMGTDIRAEGKTAELNLDLAMGGSFNKKPQDFTAESANVRMSMGAESSLCHIPKIQGTLAAGARVSVSASAQVDTGAASSFASEISNSGCA